MKLSYARLTGLRLRRAPRPGKEYRAMQDVMLSELIASTTPRSIHRPRFARWSMASFAAMFAAFAAAGCFERQTCYNPASSGAKDLQVGEVREDLLCWDAAVRLRLHVSGGHYYAVLLDLIGAAFGANKASLRLDGLPLEGSLEFQFGKVDALGGNLERSFYAARDGEVLLELANMSEKSTQGGGTGGLLGDDTILLTVLQVVDSGPEDHGAGPDEATVLQLWANLEAPQAEQTGVHDVPLGEARGPNASWAMAAELSARASPVETADHRPQKGDWLEHPKFGLCQIEGLSGDGVCFIKLPDARRKKIKVDALQLLAPRDDDGKKIFPVRPRGKQ